MAEKLDVYGGLKMTAERAAEVQAEAERIRSGVASAITPQFGFYDEPSHFLKALEDCAEPGDGEDA
jgi:hypothetical protein